jgi:ubiquinone/menaquinone biosynthesis C-methylase UbiE
MIWLSTGKALIDPHRVLQRAGLASAMTYADFGCGPLGHFVFAGADLVGPTGRVYAVDILKGALAGVESRIALESTHQITTVWGDIERTHGVNIPEASVDLVSINNITGLLLRSPEVLGEVKRVMKPEGHLLLLDWKREESPIGPPLERRVDPEIVSAAVEDGGFRRTASFEAGPHHWGMVFDRV